VSEPRFRRLEADARREQILACAVQLFGERPYADVSTTDIARAAGVARGLLNHYFGTKRELYLEVVRQMVQLPGIDATIVSTGSLRTRVERSVDWFLDTVGVHGKTFVAVTGAGGIGDDPEIEQILAAADDFAARKVLEAVGITARQRQRAVVRSYGGLVKAAVREWVRDGTLTRAEVHLLLSESLITIVRSVLPKLPATTRRKQ
jgi:AcrR family transcriptional regulator